LALFTKTFVIDSALDRTAVIEKLKPLVKQVKGFGGWIDFWLTWDGLSRIKFAGQLGESSFRLRRVHGVRFLDFVSVTARGDIQPVDSGSRIAVTIAPTAEEVWPLPLFLLFIVMNAFGSANLVEGLLYLAIAGGLPLAWFAHSRRRESRESERLLRSLLGGPSETDKARSTTVDSSQ
jgi:hypothetical protein